MSVGINIFPTAKRPIIYEIFRQKLVSDSQFVGASASVKIDGLLELPDRRKLNSVEEMRISGIYILDTVPLNGMMISFADNNLQPFSEHLMLDDVGANLDEQVRFDLGNKWYQAGFSISVSSTAARIPQEPMMFIALSACLAELCEGYVSIYEKGFFSLDIGTYSPAEFRTVQPRFSGIGPFEMNV